MHRRTRIHRVTLATTVLAIGFSAPAPALAQEAPTVLMVVAHPDDDGMFAATVYKLTHVLNGKVDLALVTDGSGGFSYAQLAEPIYGLELTEEAVARQYLPAIRKRELMAGGGITGVRNYFFLDEYDNAYTENVDTILTHVWDAERVQRELERIMTETRYDFVFVHLPTPAFHAHHKAAAILALRAAAAMPRARRPVVLGSFVGNPGDTTHTGFREHSGYPITRVRKGPSWVFDRREPLSEDGRLDYQIVVNWLIAEHKSQGTMQLLMNRFALERYWFFEVNPAEGVERADALFQRLAEPALPGIPGTREP